MVQRDYGTVPLNHHKQQIQAKPPGGVVFLLIFVVIYSANNAVLKMLLSRGYPFTVCNILCAGNMVGIITLYPFYFMHLTWKNIKKVTGAQWGFMLLGCLFANVLGSLFYLQGLSLTSVPATGIMHRLEAVNFLLLSSIFLGDHHSLWVVFNALLTVAGVVVALLEPVYYEGQAIRGSANLGYIYLLLGGWGYSLSLLLTKKYLVQIPVGILALFKVSLGTILFHLLSALEGSTPAIEHLYSWKLWSTLLWYGPIFVTLTQVLWLGALKYYTPTVLSIGMNCNFIATILWGIVLVGQYPTRAEVLGGSLILLSIVSGVCETWVNRYGRGVGDERGRGKVRERGEEEARCINGNGDGRSNGGEEEGGEGRTIVYGGGRGIHRGEGGGGEGGGLIDDAWTRRHEEGKALASIEEGEEEDDESYYLINQLSCSSCHMEDDNLCHGAAPHYIAA